MRRVRTTLALLGILILMAVAAPAEAEGPRQTPLRNVTLTDKTGTTFKLAGFYRASGADEFVGYLGAAEVQIPYARVSEMRVSAPSHPGGRPRVDLHMRSGEVVKAAFDEREAEQLFTGYTTYGRVSIFFRDIRKLVFEGRTARKDLPRFGKPATGVDVRLVDRAAVKTELVRFRRIGVENVVPGIRGAAAIAMPLRILKRVAFKPARAGVRYLEGTATLRSGETVAFRLPTYEEQTVYRGEATFGTLRIKLGQIRALEVHRVTPALRELDPVAAARGRPKPDDPPR